MPIQDVTVVSVPVFDQDRAKAFYLDKLGFQLIREDDTIPGMRWIQVSPPGATTSLTLVTWFDTMPAGSQRGLVLCTDNLHADYETFRAKGVEFDSPPQNQAWAPKGEAVCHDPDGNMLVLQQT